METVELNVEMDEALITKIHDLAMRYYGADDDAAMERVLEVAFRMRCLWSRSVEARQQEMSEAVSSWAFGESQPKAQDENTICSWLFRR